MPKYDYFQTTEAITPTKIDIAYSWYEWFRKLGHKCWIEKTRDSDGSYRYRVWRYGKGKCRGDNEDECKGLVIEASHPEIYRRFKANTIPTWADVKKRVA